MDSALYCYIITISCIILNVETAVSLNMAEVGKKPPQPVMHILLPLSPNKWAFNITAISVASVDPDMPFAPILPFGSYLNL
jgi:hypothetical protein